MLDVEESMLDYSAGASANGARRAASRRPSRATASTCAGRTAGRAGHPGECGDCLREGTTWVHLRMCVVCGHIACCDSSPGSGTRARTTRETGHPVMRSAEPGEDWRWCFVDQLTG